MTVIGKPVLTPFVIEPGTKSAESVGDPLETLFAQLISAMPSIGPDAAPATEGQPEVSAVQLLSALAAARRMPAKLSETDAAPEAKGDESSDEEGAEPEDDAVEKLLSLLTAASPPPSTTPVATPAAPSDEPPALAANLDVASSAPAVPAPMPPTVQVQPPVTAGDQPIIDLVAEKVASVDAPAASPTADAPAPLAPKIAAQLATLVQQARTDRGKEEQPVAASKKAAVPDHLAGSVQPLRPADHASSSVSPAPRADLQMAAPTVDPLSPAFDIVEAGGPPAAEVAPELHIERHLDLARESEWLDRLATDIARSGGQEGPLRFRLNPETLGSLEVQVTHGPAGASVRMIVESDAARTIIEDAQPKLAAEARAQGLRISEAHVELGGGSAGSSDARQSQSGATREPFVRTFTVNEAVIEAEPERSGDTARYA